MLRRVPTTPPVGMRGRTPRQTGETRICHRAPEVDGVADRRGQTVDELPVGHRAQRAVDGGERQPERHEQGDREDLAVVEPGVAEPLHVAECGAAGLPGDLSGPGRERLLRRVQRVVVTAQHPGRDVRTGLLRELAAPGQRAVGVAGRGRARGHQDAALAERQRAGAHAVGHQVEQHLHRHRVVRPQLRHVHHVSPGAHVLLVDLLHERGRWRHRQEAGTSSVLGRVRHGGKVGPEPLRRTESVGPGTR